MQKSFNEIEMPKNDTIVYNVAAVSGRPGKAFVVISMLAPNGYQRLGSYQGHQDKNPLFIMCSVKRYWKNGSNSERDIPQRIGNNLTLNAIMKMINKEENVNNVS